MKIVCMKWKRPSKGYQLPAVCDYGPRHVNKLGRMLKRHLTIPYEFVCVTDDPEGVEVPVIPMWDTYADLGGCYRRLKCFDPAFDLFGERFALIDLDVVITGNCDHIFGRTESFLMHEYDYPDRPNQHYNGSLILMDRGARPQVWERFDPNTTPTILTQDETRIGSDQKWISTVLGKGEPRLGVADGIHEALKVRSSLPSGACMVFFSGKRDPSQGEYGWIRQHYV